MDEKSGFADPMYGHNSSNILAYLPIAETLYRRLILVVAPRGGGKTATLEAIRDASSSTLVNVSLELSRALMALTDRQRKLHASRILRDLISRDSIESSTHTRKYVPGMVLLDNVEILFATDLALDPLRLLMDISRNRTLVVAWPGHVEGGFLTYARAGHPEHRSYPAEDLIVFGLAVSPALRP